MKNHIFRAMNSEFCLQGLNLEQIVHTKKLFKELQLLLSRFEANSEITKINSQTNVWHQVQPLTFAVLDDANRAYVETKGLYNPFMGAALSKIGYDKSFDRLTQDSSPITDYFSKKNINNCLSSQPLELDHLEQTVRLSNSAQIDLGGYAKGWSAQLVYQYLWSVGNPQGLIDAGGDIIGWGKNWEIDIADPFELDKSIATINTSGLCAIATSSTLYRRWRNSDKTVAHHIIDPRTMLSSDSDLVQVSIITDNLAKAEQLSKCLLILGSQEGANWLSQNYANVGYIAVTKQKEIIIKNRNT